MIGGIMRVVFFLVHEDLALRLAKIVNLFIIFIFLEIGVNEKIF